MPVSIDPESFVSRNDLRFDFGLTDVEIETAVRAGTLKPTRGGARFLGKDVVRFLTETNARRASPVAASVNTAPQPQSQPRATPAAGMTKTERLMTTEEAKGVVKLFNEEVVAITAHGCDRGRAIELVVKRKPTLHKMYLVATNSSPAARRQIMDTYSAE